jgi:hypothetical protein
MQSYFAVRLAARHGRPLEAVSRGRTVRLRRALATSQRVVLIRTGGNGGQRGTLATLDVKKTAAI